MFNTLLSPLSDVQRIFDMMDRTIGQLGTEGTSNRFAANTAFTLPIDVWQNGATLFVRAAVPGVSPENLDIQFQDGVLTIGGETILPKEHGESTRVWRREYAYGKFSRSVRLPDNVIDEKIQAKFDNGFMTISIPLLVQERRSLKIPLQVETSTEQKALDASINAEA